MSAPTPAADDTAAAWYAAVEQLATRQLRYGAVLGELADADVYEWLRERMSPAEAVEELLAVDEEERLVLVDGAPVARPRAAS